MSTPDILATGRFLQLVRRANWEYATRINASSVVAVVPITNDNRLLLVEQTRAPLGRNVMEIPAGLVGDHEDHTGELAEVAARRELLEETGHDAQHWTMLAHGPTTPGLSDEVMTLFLATGLTRRGPVVGDGHEQITLHEVPLADLRAFLDDATTSGCLVDIKVYSGLFLAARHRPDLLGALYGA